MWQLIYYDTVEMRATPGSNNTEMRDITVISIAVVMNLKGHGIDLGQL